MTIMMWGSASCPRFNTFEKLADKAKHARFKDNGAKIANNTYVRFKDENTLVVRLHKTDILRFHRDGSTDIATTSWATSPTTHNRLSNIGDVYVYGKIVPSVNGYKLEYPKQLFISNGYQEKPSYAYNASAHDWIRRNPDMTFDESTITPHELTCIANPQALRKTMLHMGKIAGILKGYAKLDGSDKTFEKGTIELRSWLLMRYKTPLDKLELAPLPHFKFGSESKVFGKWVKSTVNSEIRNAIDSIRYEIARREGWLGKHKVLKLG